MLKDIRLLKKEHSEIRKFLAEIEKFINGSDIVDYKPFSILFNKFSYLWNEHEKFEDELFDSSNKKLKDFPTEKMLLEQHRQLKGHCKILKNAIDSKDEHKLAVALDTDGRMLIEKFRNHLEIEDKFLDGLVPLLE